MSTYLTAHFTVEEFQAASNASLSSSQIVNARKFAVEILEPARRALGFPLKISSFLRKGDSGAHGQALAVDFHPCNTAVRDAADMANKMELLFQWIATYKTASFGKLIHERNHVHATLPGYRGSYGEVLREPQEGSFVLASFAPAALALAPIALLVLAVWWFMRRGRRA